MFSFVNHIFKLPNIYNLELYKIRVNNRSSFHNTNSDSDKITCLLLCYLYKFNPSKYFFFPMISLKCNKTLF